MFINAERHFRKRRHVVNGSSSTGVTATDHAIDNGAVVAARDIGIGIVDGMRPGITTSVQGRGRRVR